MTAKAERPKAGTVCPLCHQLVPPDPNAELRPSSWVSVGLPSSPPPQVDPRASKPFMRGNGVRWQEKQP